DYLLQPLVGVVRVRPAHRARIRLEQHNPIAAFEVEHRSIIFFVDADISDLLLSGTVAHVFGLHGTRTVFADIHEFPPLMDAPARCCFPLAARRRADCEGNSHLRARRLKSSKFSKSLTSVANSRATQAAVSCRRSTASTIARISIPSFSRSVT